MAPVSHPTLQVFAALFVVESSHLAITMCIDSAMCSYDSIEVDTTLFFANGY